MAPTQDASAMTDAIRRARLDDDGVSLPKLADVLGVSRAARREVVDSGLIKPLTGPGRGRAQVISDSDAERFAIAALVAFATGLAIVIALRLVSGGGTSVVPGVGVTIPVPGIST